MNTFSLPTPPSQSLTLAHLVWRMSHVHHRSQIVTSGRTRLTFGESADRVRSLAGALVGLGLQRGDVVATLAWNTHEHLETMLAAPLAGAVVNALNPRLGAGALLALLGKATPKALVVAAGMLDPADPVSTVVRGVVDELVREGAVVVAVGAGPTTTPVIGYEDFLHSGAGRTLPVVTEDDCAFLIHTGGTTGLPKSYAVSHRAAMLHALAQSGVDASGLSRADRLLPLAPLFHVNSWGLPFTALLTGCSIVLPGRDLNAAWIRRVLDEEAVTVGAGVPTLWYDVIEHVRSQGGAPTHLREVITGGSPVPASLVSGIQRDLGASVATAWGMTETMACTTYERELPAQRVGRPIPLVELRLVSTPDDLETSPPSGLVEVRGAFVVGTRRAPQAEGWVATGDLASVDEDGRLRIVDRVKDLIKSGGEWIPAGDLEAALNAHPAVSLAAVVAAPHPRWMERPVAYVTLLAGQRIGPQELREHLRGLMPSWWLPDRIHVVPELPRTGVGKIDKSLVRTWASHDLTDDAEGAHS
ncbi:MAG TPA: AMP-binding protein [Actinomycetes bacterium]|nr:AMP-binding protein [Actinomycetes bacterium]